MYWYDAGHGFNSDDRVDSFDAGQLRAPGCAVPTQCQRSLNWMKKVKKNNHPYFLAGNN